MARLTPMNDEYQTCERTCAELRIYGEALDTDNLTRILGVSPTRTVRKGDVRRGIRGKGFTAKSNGWFLSSESHVESKDVRRHIDWILGQVECKSNVILSVGATEDVLMTVHCAWWSRAGQGGPTLWPEQMRRLAALDLECSFDISFYGDDDE
jgi:hypothetical protein